MIPMDYQLIQRSSNGIVRHVGSWDPLKAAEKMLEFAELNSPFRERERMNETRSGPGRTEQIRTLTDAY